MREFSAAPAQGTLSYTYDAAGNVASIKSSNANGVWASYTYDEMGRLGTVVDNRLQGQQTTTYSYDAGVPVDRSSSTGWDAASNLATAAYPNQLQSTLNYDTLNRLTALSTPVSSYSYTLGPTGNRTNATEGNGRTLAWTYDNIYRLTNEAVTNDPAPASKNGSVAYTLDPVGNRKSVSSSLSGVNTAGPVTFNPDDELASGQGETYDNNGNTTLTGGRSFTFDAENHLISMNQGSTLVTLLYDGDGNRIGKTVGGATTRYLVDDLNPTGYPQVVDELVGGAVTRQYTYGLDRISENQFVGGGWTPSFYGVDGGGSVRQLTNSSGTVTDTYEYDAFGNRVSSTGTTPNNYLYRGEQFDPDLSLYYLRARYYNQVTGRFLNVDPLAGQGQRRYEYAGANPVDGSDPSGNFVLASYWPLMAPLQINIPLPSWCAQTAGNSMHKDLPPCTPPCKKCGLKVAPEYDKGPVIPGGSEFSWHATFLNDGTHEPTCCEVHQMVSWSNGPAPWWFFPPENRPNIWYEDRDPLNHRYGRRDPSTSLSHLNSWDNVYFGDQYRGADRPANWPHGEKFKFKLIVVDICNHHSIIYTSKVLHDNF